MKLLLGALVALVMASANGCCVGGGSIDTYSCAPSGETYVATPAYCSGPVCYTGTTYCSGTTYYTGPTYYSGRANYARPGDGGYARPGYGYASHSAIVRTSSNYRSSSSSAGSFRGHSTVSSHTHH